MNITTSKWLAIVAVAFVAGSFIASPELRAYAANTIASGDIIDGQVKTADLASNAVTAAKVKDGEIKAAEIATDAVGAAELQGVTKLLYGQCTLTSSEASGTVSGGGNGFLQISCTINGVDSDDTAIATFNDGDSCFHVTSVEPKSNEVVVWLENGCTFSASAGTGQIAIVVFDK